MAAKTLAPHSDFEGSALVLENPTFVPANGARLSGGREVTGLFLIELPDNTPAHFPETELETPPQAPRPPDEFRHRYSLHRPVWDQWSGG